MGADVHAFKEHAVKSVTLADGSIRRHVVPLNPEFDGVPFTWLSLARGAVRLLLGEDRARRLLACRCRADDFTVEDLTDPALLLSYVEEALRLIPAQARRLWDEVGLNYGLRSPEDLAEALTHGLKRLADHYAQGRHVLFSVMGRRTALDWWLLQEAERRERDDDQLFDEWSMLDGSWQDWFLATKKRLSQLEKEGVDVWTCTLEELSLEPRRPQKGFSLDMTEVYRLAAQQFGDWNVGIYRKYKEGSYPGGYSQVKKLLQRSDGAVGYKGKGDVSKLFKKIEGYISKIVGDLYEGWAQTMIASLPDVTEVQPRGQPSPKNEADALAIHRDGGVSVYSCKLRRTAPDSEAVSIEIAGSPELERAKELLLHQQTTHLSRLIQVRADARVKAYVLFWNLGWEAGCLKEITDPFNPPGSILIRRDECSGNPFGLTV